MTIQGSFGREELLHARGHGLTDRLGPFDDEGTALHAVPSVVQVPDFGDARRARRREFGGH